MYKFLALSLVLIFCQAATASDRFWVSNALLNDPKSFNRHLTNYIVDNYEADHAIDKESLLSLVKKCNPKKSLYRPETFLGSFDVCMDMFVFSLSAGAGTFEIENTDSLGRSYILTGSSFFLGGQLIFPSTLSSVIILETRYWFLPTLSNEKSIVEDLQKASIVENSLIYQKRPEASSWSYRLGLMAMKVPLVKDLEKSFLISQADLRFRNGWLLGPLFGLKYAYDRDYGINYLIYGDFIPVLAADNEMLGELAESFIVRFGYKKYLTRRLAATLDFQRSSFYTRYQEKTTALSWGLGLHLYLF